MWSGKRDWFRTVVVAHMPDFVLYLTVSHTSQELADLLADSNSKSKVVLREDTKRGESTELQLRRSKNISNM